MDVRRYWRLQDTYLPTLQPMFYCSGIVVYGYGVRANGEVVWKYPTAAGYIRALKAMKNAGQLLHRGNPVHVYAAVGGAHEDSANMSAAAGNNPGYFAANMGAAVMNISTPWKVSVLASLLNFDSHLDPLNHKGERENPEY
ncbi:hypothetical protein HPB51_000319 [Rhipicephalus microplus]|uniref:Uncharacterized protein n=1 Tax=Rhipicephalus microplus TaxID=6941 RepID=A0A9J6EKN6_RHIMP|nr:hypothetical protein HPB51_000319 [Rhipicephalus microplus]